MDQLWSSDGATTKEERCQEGFSNAKPLSFLSLRLRVFALNYFERENHFLLENLAVSDILCIFACN